VISALAGNVDTVRWQQENANKAFKEATSVTKEFTVQNTTVQAELDKARKRVKEMAVELGEKLKPVMAHVISGTTMTLRMLSTMVDFLMNHKTAIISVTAAVAAYTIAVNASNIAFKAQYYWLVITNAAHKAGAAIQATYRTAVLLCSVAVNKLTGNTTGRRQRRGCSTRRRKRMYMRLS
jgi:predicted site-specific integrase-resolvase